MKSVYFFFLLLQIFCAATTTTHHDGTSILKIVGGVKAKYSENQSMGALLRDGEHVCGCSIIGNYIVLTAAHCVPNGISADRYKVVTGTLYVGDSQVDQSHSSEHNVSYIDVHERYVSVEYAFDIAILRTKTKILYSSYVQPAVLPRQGEDHCDYATVWGWGTTSNGGSLSDDLLKVDVSSVDYYKCALNYGKEGYTVYKIYQLCYGSELGGKDSCAGDSGGPLTCKTYPNYQIGIVSYGIGCAEAKYPGVYTRVSVYHDWIANKIIQYNSGYELK